MTSRGVVVVGIKFVSIKDMGLVEEGGTYQNRNMTWMKLRSFDATTIVNSTEYISILKTNKPKTN